jgi:hypothetical protein
MNTKAYVILFSLFLAACGGGTTESGPVEKTPPDVNVTVVDPGTDEPEAPEVPSYETHSTNISGVWTGTAHGGATVNITALQVAPDSAENPAQALTGTIILSGGPPIDVTGSKEGDTWSLSGASTTSILSVGQTLSSAGGSSGTISITPSGGEIEIVVDLSLVKI